MLEVPREFINHLNFKSTLGLDGDLCGNVYAPEQSIIAFDLDGTLAEVTPEGRYHPYPIGPINPKIKRVLEKWVSAGFKVVVFTARPLSDVQQSQMISTWLLQNGLSYVPVTNIKSPDMLVIYDDRAIGVSENSDLKLYTSLEYDESQLEQVKGYYEEDSNPISSDSLDHTHGGM